MQSSLRVDTQAVIDRPAATRFRSNPTICLEYPRSRSKVAQDCGHVGILVYQIWRKILVQLGPSLFLFSPPQTVVAAAFSMGPRRKFAHKCALALVALVPLAKFGTSLRNIKSNHVIRHYQDPGCSKEKCHGNNMMSSYGSIYVCLHVFERLPAMASFFCPSSIFLFIFSFHPFSPRRTI